MSSRVQRSRIPVARASDMGSPVRETATGRRPNRENPFSPRVDRHPAGRASNPPALPGALEDKRSSTHLGGHGGAMPARPVFGPCRFPTLPGGGPITRGTTDSGGGRAASRAGAATNCAGRRDSAQQYHPPRGRYGLHMCTPLVEPPRSAAVAVEKEIGLRECRYHNSGGVYARWAENHGLQRLRPSGLHCGPPAARSSRVSRATGGRGFPMSCPNEAPLRLVETICPRATPLPAR